MIKSSKDIFRVHRWIWKIFGLVPPKNNRVLYSFWAFVLVFGIMLFYPLHLALGLIEVQSRSEVFSNLSILITDVQFSLKYFIIWYNLRNLTIVDVEDIFTTMDARIKTEHEKMHFRKTARICTHILYGIAIVYGFAGITSQLAVMVASERRLMFPAWFPFDWTYPSTNYWTANMYQFIGLTIKIITTYSSDTYTTVSLATLSGHTQLLAMRLSELGGDPSKSLRKHNEELKMCIKDHSNLIRLYHVLGKVLSVSMFFQILCTGINISLSLMILIFYTDNVVTFLYYCVNVTALSLQIYPSCYFGSVFETEFENLPYALFSCNWVDQDREFRQNILTFTQRGLQKTEFDCMGFFKINLSSFVVTIKSGYSLLSVIVQTK